jgi:hypothetical protein
MPEERRVGAAAASPARRSQRFRRPSGDREAGRDERQTGGMHGRNRRAHQRDQPLRAGLVGVVRGRGLAIGVILGGREDRSQRDLFTGGDRGDVLGYLQQAVCRCQPAQMVRRRGP